jgi:Domain of unknown function (DUF1937)
MSFWYLASPYSKYPGGTCCAYDLAVENTELLLQAGITVMSPIVHNHLFNMRARKPYDWDFWWPIDSVYLKASKGLIFLMAESWHISWGMAAERELALELDKPIIDMKPSEVPIRLLRRT